MPATSKFINHFFATSKSVRIFEVTCEVKSSKKSVIAPQIDEQPSLVDKRCPIYGYEADTVISKRGRAVLVTLAIMADILLESKHFEERLLSLFLKFTLSF